MIMKKANKLSSFLIFLFMVTPVIITAGLIDEKIVEQINKQTVREERIETLHYPLKEPVKSKSLYKQLEVLFYILLFIIPTGLLLGMFFSLANEDKIFFEKKEPEKYTFEKEYKKNITLMVDERPEED